MEPSPAEALIGEGGEGVASGGGKLLQLTGAGGAPSQEQNSGQRDQNELRHGANELWHREPMQCGDSEGLHTGGQAERNCEGVGEKRVATLQSLWLMLIATRTLCSPERGANKELKKGLGQMV